MAGDERQVYFQLISDLRRAVRNIDVLLMNIQRYENYISVGLVINENITFNKDLNQMKETLNYKRNKIRNEFIPSLQMMMQQIN